jgi:hypothetical protein
VSAAYPHSYLDLSHSNFNSRLGRLGASGVKYLGAVLHTNKTLTDLVLTGCGLDKYYLPLLCFFATFSRW